MVFAYEQFSRHLDLSHMITQANQILMDQEECYNLHIVDEYDLEDKLINIKILLIFYNTCMDTTVHNGITNDCFDKQKT